MFRAITGSAVVLLAALGGRSAEPTKSAPADEAARVKGLSAANDLYRLVHAAEKANKKDEVKKHMARFVTQIQLVAPYLPVIEPEEAAKPKRYHTLALNAEKTKLDAFRFRVPSSGKTWNLNWEFVIPRESTGANLLAWYIVPREGTMRGFEFVDRDDDFSEKGADLPKSNYRFKQQLAGGRLKAGSEYVIWFALKDDKPVDVHVRIGLTPFGK